MKTTFSIIKADVGGWPGHAYVHPDLKEIANIKLRDAQVTELIKDFHVTNCGDDLELIMTHTNGVDSKEVHNLAWDVFCEATEKAQELGLYGAGQDLLVDAFNASSLTQGQLIVLLWITFLIMGMIMESVSMMIIFIPFVFPIITAAGIDPIWFGIFMVLACECGALTPPIGLLLFVLQMVTELKFSDIVRSIWPFIIILNLSLVILWFFPQIALWLPYR